MSTLPPARKGIYRRLANRLQKEGGFSFPAPRNGVMVSRKGAEEVVEGVASAEDIADYANRHATELQSVSNAHIGGWVSEGKTYLDISQRFPRRHQQADHALAANDQQAGWDVTKSAERPTAPALPGILEANVDPVHPNEERKRRSERQRQRLEELREEGNL